MLQSSDSEVIGLIVILVMIMFAKQGCLSKWLSPRKKRKKGQHKELREPVNVKMV